MGQVLIEVIMFGIRIVNFMVSVMVSIIVMVRLLHMDSLLCDVNRCCVLFCVGCDMLGSRLYNIMVHIVIVVMRPIVIDHRLVIISHIMLSCLIHVWFIKYWVTVHNVSMVQL